MGEWQYNPSPEEVHKCEQRWSSAETLLDQVIEKLSANEAHLKETFGLSDASMTFDYMLTYLKYRHSQNLAEVQMTEVVCAAALTRLARRAAGTDNDMAQFERKLRDE